MSALSIQVKDLRQELTVAKELHGNEIKAFEAQVAELTEAKEGLETKINEVTEASNALALELETVKADLSDAKAEAEASDARADELQKELDEAKAALEDPSFGDVAESGAEPAPAASSDDVPSIEKLRSLSGSERVKYFAEHRSALIR